MKKASSSTASEILGRWLPSTKPYLGSFGRIQSLRAKSVSQRSQRGFDGLSETGFSNYTSGAVSGPNRQGGPNRQVSAVGLKRFLVSVGTTDRRRGRRAAETPGSSPTYLSSAEATSLGRSPARWRWARGRFVLHMPEQNPYLFSLWGGRRLTKTRRPECRSCQDLRLSQLGQTDVVRHARGSHVLHSRGIGLSGLSEAVFGPPPVA